MNGKPSHMASEFARLIAIRVPLEAQDGNLRGSCPLYPDPYRSFYVNPRRPFFHCFSCGTSGGPSRWRAILARL